MTERPALTAETEGAIAIARFWLYDHPSLEIPDREARVIARGLMSLARALSADTEAPDG